MKKALLIIDVQNDYFPDGNCELYKPEIALNNIKLLLEKFRVKKFTCFLCSTYSKQTSYFFCA